jgi:hypothetical protein
MPRGSSPRLGVPESCGDNPRLVTASSAGPLRIAGAGPSGLVAATLLARAGREVVVHEQNATVGARFIGDFQVIEDASDPRETVPEMLARLSLSPPPWTPATHARFFDARTCYTSTSRLLDGLVLATVPLHPRQ